MNLELNKLVNTGKIDIDTIVTFPNEYLINTTIKALENVHVTGYVKYSITDEFEIVLTLSGTMILEDSITLDNVPYPFNIEINDIIEENNVEYAKYFKNNQNTLDIIEILWENIVLEVPISYTLCEGKNLKGNGWELNGVKSDNEVDPRLAKLKDIFKGGE